MRIAVFVEGQTELIVVREVILKYYEYADIEIECRTLFTDSRLLNAEYDYSSPNASKFFQIINVGNDNAVLSRILKRENLMWNAGYDFIIGLRDMYSATYRKICSDIDENVIEKFIEGSVRTIEESSQRPDRIFLCFGIMEVEAWILGIRNIFQALSSELTLDFIEEKLALRLDQIDPEKEFFHPATIIEDIYSLVGKSYKKKKGDIEAIASHINRDQIVELNEAEYCNSFTVFMRNIIK